MSRGAGHRQSEGRLWISDSNGSNRRQLTFDDGGTFHHDIEPAWSPDGARIAFLRNFRNSDPACADLCGDQPRGPGLLQLAPTPLPRGVTDLVARRHQAGPCVVGRRRRAAHLGDEAAGEPSLFHRDHPLVARWGVDRPRARLRGRRIRAHRHAGSAGLAVLSARSAPGMVSRPPSDFGRRHPDHGHGGQ